MSQENLEIAVRSIDAFNECDLDALVELVTPDFQWRPSFPASVGSNPILGVAEALEYIREIDETWQVFRLVVEGHRDLGDRVLLIGQGSRGLVPRRRRYGPAKADYHPGES